MAEEIRFFGFNSNFSMPDVRQELESAGITTPASCLMTRSEVDRFTQKDFPWPLLVEVPSKTPSKVVFSWEELRDTLDEIRDPGCMVSFKLPNLNSPDSIKNSTSIYLGNHFICIHNLDLDLGLTISMDNSSLYKNTDPSIVFRLVCGYHGIALDGMYSGEHFSAITANKLHHLSDPSKFSDFRTGYIYGFLTKNSYIKNLSYSEESYIGDPKVFGIVIGSLFCRKLLEITGLDRFEDIDSIGMAINIFSKGKDVASKVANIIRVHNKIINSDIDPNALVNGINNLCSDPFDLNFSNIKFWDLANKSYYLSKDMTEFSNFVLDPSDPNKKLLIRNIAEDSTIKTSFYSETISYRILGYHNDGVRLRLQFFNPELIHKVCYEGEETTVVSWKKHLLWETELFITSKDIKDISWSDWCSLVSGASFDKDSLYHGSSNKYAQLKNTDSGFALNNGLVIIYKDYFLSFINKAYSLGVLT